MFPLFPLVCGLTLKAVSLSVLFLITAGVLDFSDPEYNLQTALLYRIKKIVHHRVMGRALSSVIAVSLSKPCALGYISDTLTLYALQCWLFRRDGRRDANSEYAFGISRRLCWWVYYRPLPAMLTRVAVGLALASSFPTALGAKPGSPNANDWNQLNQTVGGRLFPGKPFAEPCFSSYEGKSKQVDQTACTYVQQNFFNSHCTYFIADRGSLTYLLSNSESQRHIWRLCPDKLGDLHVYRGILRARLHQPHQPKSLCSPSWLQTGQCSQLLCMYPHDP